LGFTKKAGDAAETQALHHLLQHGLVLVQRNYRVARGPHRRGGEIDLIVRDPDGTLVFVEVRQRSDASHGGAAASITARKRASLVLAARHYIARWPSPPPCRFDVVTVDGGASGSSSQVQWLRAAFDAGG
jgi:putative endonuclease